MKDIELSQGSQSTQNISNGDCLLGTTFFISAVACRTLAAGSSELEGLLLETVQSGNFFLKIQIAANKLWFENHVRIIIQY